MTCYGVGSANEADLQQQNFVDLTIYTEHFPPYNFQRQGTITGINVAIVREICEQVGIDCQFVQLPWKRAYRMAEQNTSAGLVSVARLPERESSFNWIGPLVSGQNCFYKLARRYDIVVNKANDLANYKLAVSKDNAYSAILTELGFVAGQNMLLVTSKIGVLDPFLSGRTDLLINSATSIKAYVGSANLSMHDIAPVFMLPQSKIASNYLALNLAVPDFQRQKMQLALSNLRQANQLEKIRKSFFQQPKSQIPANVDSQLWEQCMVEN